MTMFVLCLIYCIILENNSNIKAIEQFENWFRKQTKYTFPFLLASCYRINLFLKTTESSAISKMGKMKNAFFGHLLQDGYKSLSLDQSLTVPAPL